MFAFLQTLLEFNSHVTLFQRMMFLFSFCISGIILAVQASQAGEPDHLRIRWTRLTEQSRPYWYTFYVTQVFLFVTGAYPMLYDKMTMYIGSGYEEQILNIIWVGLLSVEALMVAGVAGVAITRKFKGAPKQKTN
ncbi:hypothetical protein COL5a_004704 [Colletotrichum fioriniae]|uniref:Uncharacterized protein n=2 Tax=Colletotrichum acutatum species complex TaxID=2707335 RepID=A0A135U0J0_9PEZI|nr:uncharacterized protein COL516b_011559 [Colletotrichum fioriniae]XP_060429541.1 uncharacterized protein BDP55DRAFT_694035 [Colletotrichum godetiae]KXH53913.1 hypothetical protein CSAL01_05949 [Colletotrichum salicis]KAJ0296531.1 hypothetical protein COL516b_011559 [Colletotrichum fioriniae]KAJ0328912.1 hypothetical protein COL5a_004704 [Colletotrichum fioriniae]KAJ3940458.1 hypothetical protein N0V96_009459 [Colletotrichum fioriniae]KAK1675538.1 hypothetical protein BDP55DRAFT_694035 [Coll